MTIGDTVSLSNELSALFNNILIYDRRYDIIPNKNHYGIAIKYSDIQECRQEFIDELVNTIADWIYSQDRQNEIIISLMQEGRSKSGSFTRLLHMCRQKFRSTTNSKLLHGQFGELVLFVTLEKLFGARPILRKMPITTSPHHERFGADAIHYRKDDGKNIIFLGEAKTYTSNYKFNEAFKDAITSIIDSYEKHRVEIGTYVFDGFIDPEALSIAKHYVNNTLDNYEIHLVSTVIYNETSAIELSSQSQIEQQIDNIIAERYSRVDKRMIDIDGKPILNRITYVVLPIWNLEGVIETFTSSIN